MIRSQCSTLRGKDNALFCNEAMFLPNFFYILIVLGFYVAKKSAQRGVLGRVFMGEVCFGRKFSFFGGRVSRFIILFNMFFVVCRR